VRKTRRYDAFSPDSRISVARSAADCDRLVVGKPLGQVPAAGRSGATPARPSACPANKGKPVIRRNRSEPF